MRNTRHAVTVTLQDHVCVIEGHCLHSVLLKLVKSVIDSLVYDDTLADDHSFLTQHQIALVLSRRIVADSVALGPLCHWLGVMTVSKVPSLLGYVENVAACVIHGMLLVSDRVVVRWIKQVLANDRVTAVVLHLIHRRVR